MSEFPESIIGFAIARCIREQPEQAAAEMLKLIRENASLEAENARLKALASQYLGFVEKIEFSG